MDDIQTIDAQTAIVCEVCGSDEKIVRKMTQWPGETHHVERWMCKDAVKCNKRRENIRKEAQRSKKKTPRQSTAEEVTEICRSNSVEYTNEDILIALERSRKNGRHAERKMYLRILHGDVPECPCSQREQEILCRGDTDDD